RRRTGRTDHPADRRGDRRVAVGAGGPAADRRVRVHLMLPGAAPRAAGPGRGDAVPRLLVVLDRARPLRGAAHVVTGMSTALRPRSEIGFADAALTPPSAGPMDWMRR